MTDQNSPAWRSPAYDAMKLAWMRCRDVRAGTDKLREKKALYLPKYIAEDPLDWETRVSMTVVVDFFEQAVQAFVGLGLRNDPELGKDTPQELVDDWENLDGEGNHGAVVAGFALDAALTDGHVVLFSEYPKVDRLLRADEQDALGLRPYVVMIRADRIPSWRVGVVGAERILLQFVVEECVDVADGAFGSKSVTRYRKYVQQFETTTAEDRVTQVPDLTRGYVTWELWEETKESSGSYALTDSGRIYGPTRIPARVVYGGNREGILCSKPPLDGLAHSNIRWAQVASDRAYSLHKCGIPIPVIIGKLVGPPQQDGKPPADLVISSSRGVNVEAGGDFKITEATGTALEQSRLELEDWEKRMGAQSLAVLQRDVASAETATAHRMNHAREDSKLLRLLRSLEDALEGVLMDFAAYRGITDPAVLAGLDVTIRGDIGDVVSPVVLQLLSDLESRGQLTLSRLLAELQRAGIMGNDFDAEQEAAAVARGAASEPMTAPDPATMTDAEITAEIARLEAGRTPVKAA